VHSEAEIIGADKGTSLLTQEARVIERLRIIEAAEAESVSEAARRFGCSRTTVYKLLARYLEGADDRPRGPLESKAA
jgi:transposase